MKASLLASLLALPGLLLPAPPAPSQEPAPGGREAASAAQEAGVGTPEHVGQGYESPRACMRAFLEAARAVHLEGDEGAEPKLLRALDLSPWIEDGTWKAEGIERSWKLYETLNRTAKVELDELPDESARGSSHAWSAVPPGSSHRVVVRFTRGGTGGWVVSAATLRGVPADYDAVRGLPVVEALLSDLPLLERLRERLRERLPGPLTGEGFVLENWQWLGILLLVFIGVLLDRLVRFLIASLVRRLERAESLKLKKGALANFERPFGLFFIAYVFAGLLPVLGLEPTVRGILDLAASFVMTVTGIWAAIRLVDLLCDFLRAKAATTESRFDDMLIPLLRKTLRIVVSIVGLVYIASKLTEQVYTILAGLSIGSLAVGFAAKDSIENLFGTFTVLMDKPFQLGDWIVFGDIEGSVERVGFRSTRVRTFYNSVITVPNSRFISAHVDNMGERRYRRVKTTLSLTYDTPPELIDAFCEALRELVRRHPYTRKDYYFVQFNAFGASSLDVLLYAFLDAPDWGTELREKHRLFNDVLRIAARLGVSFAFPTQSLHVVQPEDLEHSDVPPDWQAAEKLGEEVGREVAEAGLAPFGGERPRPAVVRKPSQD